MDLAIRHINSDGTIVLEDGREGQLIIRNGLIAAKAITTQDRVDALDQAEGGGNPVPTLEGFDQIG